MFLRLSKLAGMPPSKARYLWSALPAELIYTGHITDQHLVRVGCPISGGIRFRQVQYTIPRPRCDRTCNRGKVSFGAHCGHPIRIMTSQRKHPTRDTRP